MSHEYLSRRSFLTIRELAEEKSVAEIAQSLCLTQATVVAVLEGRLLPSRIVVDDDDPLREEMLTARRCQGCGALVFRWPCLACAMAAGKQPPKRLSGSAVKRKRQRARDRDFRLARARIA